MTSSEIVFQVRKMEKALVRLPEVEDVVVLSEENPNTGYALKVFVEPSVVDQGEGIAEIIKKFCSNQGILLPLKIIFGKIPRTPSGKIARYQLLQMA